MNYFEQKKQQYKNLNYKQKKEFITNILIELKNWENIFEDLYTLVENIEDIQENFLDMCFDIIFGAIDTLKKQDNETNQKKLSDIKEKLKKLKFLEDQENEKDNFDANNLIDSI